MRTNDFRGIHGAGRGGAKGNDFCASASWLIAHLLLVAAFALLPCALLAIYAALADGPAESRALRGLILGVAGTGFVVPAVGVEVFAMPVIARLYLDGVTGVAPALRWIYWGPMTLVLIMGLITLAVGAIELARAPHGKAVCCPAGPA